MNHKYFVSINGAQEGPFTIDDIYERWCDTPGVIDTIMVWREGMDSWCLLSSLPKTGTEGVAAPVTANRIVVAGSLMRWLSHRRIAVGISVIIVITVSILLWVSDRKGFANSLSMKSVPSATPEKQGREAGPPRPSPPGPPSSTPEKQAREANSGLTAFISADDRFTKALEVVKTAEDFSNALNHYCDKFDEFTNWIDGFQTLTPAEKEQRLAEIFKWIDKYFHSSNPAVKAREIAIENLHDRFNNSPNAAKALLRVSQCYSRLGDSLAK